MYLPNAAPGQVMKLAYSVPLGVIPTGIRYFQDPFCLGFLGLTCGQINAANRKQVNREKKLAKKAGL